MSLFGRVLQGIGAALIEKGKEDFETQKTELLYQRELALKQLEFQHDDALAATQHQDKVDELHIAGSENRRTDLFKGVIDERRAQAKDSRDLTHDITMKGIDFKNDKSMEAFKQKNRLSEDQFQSMLTSKREAETEGHKVNRVVFSTNGQMQLVMDNGDIVSKGPASAYNPSGSNQEDLGDYLNSGGASSGGSVSGGGISPRSTPPHSTQAAAAPQSVLSQLAAAPPPPDGQVGRTMTGPNGYKAQWNGKQWVLADVNGGQ